MATCRARQTALRRVHLEPLETQHWRGYALQFATVRIGNANRFFTKL
jgi:hypothetical protein